LDGFKIEIGSLIMTCESVKMQEELVNIPESRTSVATPEHIQEADSSKEINPESIESHNAVKINSKKLPKHVKEGLKRFKSHWNDGDDVKAYTCPIANKIAVDTYLINEGIEFILSEIHDAHFELPQNLQKASRMGQAERKISKELVSHLKELGSLIKDYNTRWKTNLNTKDILNATDETIKELANSDDSKQIENLKTIFAESKRLKEINLQQKTINEKIRSLEENSKEKKELRYGDYIIDVTGLYHYPESQENDLDDLEEKPKEPKKTWISSPIWPEAYLRDKEGKGHTLLIRMFDGEKDHKIALPRRLITKWAELSEILLDLGQKISMSPINQKHLQNFLQGVKSEKLMRCVDKSGWHGEQYIFPDGEVLGKTKEISEGVYPINEACPRGIEKKGSLEEWQDHVLKLCANNSRLIFSVGVAISAPCLHLVGDEGGVFNFKGSSSIGKTRCLMVSISVFGSPEFKRSWRTTSNGLEGICSLHNDCLLALDEFGQSDAKEVGEIAYMYSQGIGKQRSGRDGAPRESKTWRGMLFSTGEVGISDHMQEDKNKPKAGQLVRVIDIPAKVEGAFGCFEDLHGLLNGQDGEIFADKIKEVCGGYYGTAGREFIKAIIEYGVEKSRRELKFVRDDFAADVAGKYDGQVKRVANRFGLVLASLSLGIDLGVFSKYLTKEMAGNAIKSCFNDWLHERGTTGSLESHSIIDHVIGLLNENSDSKFIPKNDVNDTRIRQTLWGYKDGATFYLFSKAFNDLCKGYEKQQAKQALIDAKLLLPGGGGKVSRSISIPAHSKKERYYVIDLNNLQDDEEDA
jgi:uncharacterized protein (DUF927 family)